MLRVALTGEDKTVVDGAAWLKHWKCVQGHANYSVDSWLDWYLVHHPCPALGTTDPLTA